MLIEIQNSKQITGLMFAYSLICQRKLWLYANDIRMEHESEDIEIGKYIDENSYIREKKQVLVDNKINIDYLKNGIVYEIKKSSATKEAAVYQIKYYLYVLKEKGINNPKGVLKIPKEKYVENISLTEQDILFIKKQLNEIIKIIRTKKIPALETKKICKKCAYYEMCHI